MNPRLAAAPTTTAWAIYLEPSQAAARGRCPRRMALIEADTAGEALEVFATTEQLRSRLVAGWRIGEGGRLLMTLADGLVRHQVVYAARRQAR